MEVMVVVIAVGLLCAGFLAGVAAGAVVVADYQTRRVAAALDEVCEEVSSTRRGVRYLMRITKQEVVDLAELAKRQQELITALQSDDEADKAKIAELQERVDELTESVGWLDDPELDAAIDDALGRTAPDPDETVGG